MRLILDENLGLRWRNRLRDAGHDVDTVSEEDLCGSPDVSVLDTAIAADRALVTLDNRFPVRPTPRIAVLLCVIESTYGVGSIPQKIEYRTDPGGAISTQS